MGSGYCPGARACNSSHLAPSLLSGCDPAQGRQPDDEDAGQLRARDIAVALDDPSELAVTASAGTIDGSAAMRIADLSIDARAAEVLGGPGPSVKWRDLAAAVGTKVDSVKRASTVQEAVQATADAAVESNAGVNLDEEMSNMLLWQRAYGL